VKWSDIAGVILLCGLFRGEALTAEPLSRFVEVDGISIHYLESGRAAAEDPTLLMVHGYCGSGEDFRPLLQALPDSFHSIAVDLPGGGFSGKPDAPYDCDYFVAFLRSFCVRMGLRSFVLVGHSMGGQIAIHYATRWPEAVQRLVLISPYGLAGEEGGMGTLARLGPLVDIGYALNTRLFIQWAIQINVLYRPAPETLRAVVDSTAANILGCEGARAVSRVTRAVIGHDQVDALLPAVSADTLVIWGDHDRVLPPQWASAFVTRLPAARLALIPDTGHMPMTERPGLTAIVLMGFLSDRRAVGD